MLPETKIPQITMIQVLIEAIFIM